MATFTVVFAIDSLVIFVGLFMVAGAIHELANAVRWSK